MSENELEGAILIADISGSTPLYEEVGDADALRLVSTCLDNMRAVVRREGGRFIRSKGDDVLSVFSDSAAALTAARTMLSQQTTGPLSIHVGLSFGHLIHARGDVFGDSVHLTARLASLAKSGEILASESFVDQLPDVERSQLQTLDKIILKGKSKPIQVYALIEDDTSTRTMMSQVDPAAHTRTEQSPIPEVTVTVRYADKTFTCSEKATLSLGRSKNCDVVISKPWISREHAELTVRRGKLQLSDHSSSGTYVSVQDDYEFLLRRETVLLTGSGIICPGVQRTADGAETISYEVTVGQGALGS